MAGCQHAQAWPGKELTLREHSTETNPQAPLRLTTEVQGQLSSWAQPSAQPPLGCFRPETPLVSHMRADLESPAMGTGSPESGEC